MQPVRGIEETRPPAGGKKEPSGLFFSVWVPTARNVYRGCCRFDPYGNLSYIIQDIDFFQKIRYTYVEKVGCVMPEISLFCGIRVTMFYSDHNPPHFHAEYGGFKALIDIQNSCVIRGALPGRQLKLILAWCELHKDELMQNWELARTAAPLNHIAPLI